MIAALILVPMVAGAAIWLLAPTTGARARSVPAAASTAALAATVAVAVASAVTGGAARVRWGPALELTFELTPVAAAFAVTVPAVALATALYASAHEPVAGLRRQVGLLVAFVGAMEIVVLAADLLTVLIGWELVAAISWGLIGHEWRDVSTPQRAAHAFNATRAGGIGLFVAAGATFATTGGFTYADVATVPPPVLHVVAAGVVAAAVAKSAQLPFAPWLFSAMAGPTPVSALLHSATMVAAGAYLLIRLQPALEPTGWFGPLLLTVGLVTALVGGVVAVLQDRAKHLLAASTSAQYGLMLVAIGAGFPIVATAHLIAHAAFKALLFLTAGVAISAADSPLLAGMSLGAPRRPTAVLSLIGAAALAAVPPLGGGWSKEQIVAAATNADVVAGVAVIAAGGLSALYIARFQLLAFGSRGGEEQPRALHHPPGRSEVAAMTWLAAATVALSILWLPQIERLVERVGPLPKGAPWELAASWAAVALAVYAAVVGDRAGWLASLGTGAFADRFADWLQLPELSRRGLVDPLLRVASWCRGFDDHVVDGAVRAVAQGATATAAAVGLGDRHVVDAGVRGIAALTRRIAEQWTRLSEQGTDGVVRAIAGGLSWGARDVRRIQTGAAHHYLTTVTVGTAIAVLVTALWR